MATARGTYQIVDALIADLDRRGLGHEWRKVDAETQESMRQKWFRIIQWGVEPKAAGEADKRTATLYEITAKPEPQKPPACSDCRFFVARAEKSDGALMGTCHRYPPQIDAEGEAVWPYMLGNRGDAWCGEFQPKPVESNLATGEQMERWARSIAAKPGEATP